MKVTDEQKATVEQEWGADAANILELIAKKKGKCNFFNEDGTLAKSKEEIVASLNKESKPKAASKTADWKTAINGLSFEALEEVQSYVSAIIAKKKADEIAQLEARLKELKGE